MTLSLSVSVSSTLTLSVSLSPLFVSNRPSLSFTFCLSFCDSLCLSLFSRKLEDRLPVRLLLCYRTPWGRHRTWDSGPWRREWDQSSKPLRSSSTGLSSRYTSNCTGSVWSGVGTFSRRASYSVTAGRCTYFGFSPWRGSIGTDTRSDGGGPSGRTRHVLLPPSSHLLRPSYRRGPLTESGLFTLPNGSQCVRDNESFHG